MAPFQYIERPTHFSTKGGKTLPIFAVTPAHVETGTLEPLALDWAKKAGFKAEAGALLLIPTEDGHLGGALLGLGSNPSESPFLTGKLARTLPAGDWHVETAPLTANRLLLGYGLGAYSFDRYRSERPTEPKLLIPQDADAADIKRQLAGVYLARDLINTPANDMSPADIEAAVRRLAEHYKAEVTVTTGDELLEKNFPLIHAVGRASTVAPRLIEMRWGKKGHRKLTLVGKGVSFDTGGLDIKPSSSMLLMKKDMGGAANVLGLALMIMDAKLKIDLTVIIPAVENSIAGNAFRPGDVYKSRKGLTVQIDNTDAEGRLVLCDALWYCNERFAPEFMINLATLTGAILVALGNLHAGLFCNDDELAENLLSAGLTTKERLWRMPLGPEYDKQIDSQFADMKNTGGRHAGSITAAQFLKRFVKDTPWAHLDIAGTAMGSPSDEINQSWGSGFGVRLLDELVRASYEA